MYFTIEISQIQNSFIARCAELDISGYGSSKDEAVERLKRIINFYVQSADEMVPADSSEVQFKTLN